MNSPEIPIQFINDPEHFQTMKNDHSFPLKDDNLQIQNDSFLEKSL